MTSQYKNLKKDKDEINKDVEFLYEMYDKMAALKMRHGDTPDLMDKVSFDFYNSTRMDPNLAKGSIISLFGFALKDCNVFVNHMYTQPVWFWTAKMTHTGAGKSATRTFFFNPAKPVMMNAMASIRGMDMKDCSVFFAQSDSLATLVDRAKKTNGHLLLDIDEMDNFLEKTKKDSEFREFVQCASGAQ